MREGSRTAERAVPSRANRSGVIIFVFRIARE